MDQTRIFISHAGQDKPLADLIVDVLVRSGLSRSRIFYSSDRSTGIPAGESSRSHLKAKLAERPLVLGLVTSTFVTRPMCWMELGAAWALDLPTFPIIVPPMTREQAGSGLGDAQVGTLGEKREIDLVFNDLHGRIARDLGQTLPNEAWNPAVDRFRDELPAVLHGIGSHSVPAEHEPAFLGRSPVSSTAAPTREVKPGLIISNDRLHHGRLGTEILGSITNDSRHPRSSVILSGTLYDADGGIVAATRQTIVNELAPRETRTFRLTCRDSAEGAERHEVQVDRVGQ